MTTIWPIIVMIVAIAVLAKNRTLLGKLKGSSEKLGLSDPRILIALGIILFNLVSWAMIPWWWGILAYTWYGFLIFNFGFWTVLYLRTIKTKNDKGEETKEFNPTASKMATIIALVLVVGLITTAVYYFQRDGLSKTDYTKKMVAEEPIRREAILRAICLAESGCQQFESDGKTALRGRIDPDDTGMFQINKRIHAKLIAETKLDPNTLEGNVQLANVLYDKYGTTPWNRSRNRWARELERISPRLSRSFVLATIKIPMKEWSEEIYNPIIDRTLIRWDILDKTKGGECQVMLDGDPNKVFSVNETRDDFSPPGVLQFKCAEPSAQIRVRVVPNT